MDSMSTLLSSESRAGSFTSNSKIGVPSKYLESEFGRRITPVISRIPQNMFLPVTRVSCHLEGAFDMWMLLVGEEIRAICLQCQCISLSSR